MATSPDTAQLQTDYASQTGLFASKMAELQSVQNQLLSNFAMIDPSDTDTYNQWNDAYDKVTSAINAGNNIQAGINKVEGWYQDAINWTSDQMWNVGHALGLNGIPQADGLQGLGGLGIIQAAAVAGVVASIAAWLAVAAIALTAAYAAIQAVNAHYNPSAIQNYQAAHDAVYNADISSGKDPATALQDANSQFPPLQAPVDTSSFLGTVTGGVQQIALYGILAWLALQIIKG